MTTETPPAPGGRRSTEDRAQVLDGLYPSEGDRGHWWFRYLVMLGLSVVIATMGLSLDSAAVVIGAMLVAPLMTPVLGLSAAMVMGWPSRLGHSAVAVLAGIGWVVVLALAITSVLPGSDRVLTAEILARTSPDLRDLVVALAAGAAGAYATVRSDVAAALPGVAVAVALVPPLSSVGFILAIGRPGLALGALLLFAVNLAAIVLAGGVVLLGSGFVPAIGGVSGRRVRARLALVAAATCALAVPLAVASVRSVHHFDTTQAVNESVLTWLASTPHLEAGNVVIQGRRVTVDVSGPVRPPSPASLEQALRATLGPSATLKVRWSPT